MNILSSDTVFRSIKTAGIGLTNKCNLNCSHCYSRKMTERNIGVKDAEKILSVFPNLESVNFGTGESILNDQFESIVNLFYKQGIKLAITSNGLSINKMSESVLTKFEDVDISIDFPSAEKHDEWRNVKVSLY